MAFILQCERETGNQVRLPLSGSKIFEESDKYKIFFNTRRKICKSMTVWSVESINITKVYSLEMVFYLIFILRYCLFVGLSMFSFVHSNWKTNYWSRIRWLTWPLKKIQFLSLSQKSWITLLLSSGSFSICTVKHHYIIYYIYIL